MAHSHKRTTAEHVNPNTIQSVFQITFKGRVSTVSFEGSIDVGLPTSSQVYHLFCRVKWPAVSGF